MGTEQSSTQGASNNVSRRRVVAGAAWSVPAVMVASAAPAVAASPGFLTFTGEACKLPGNATDTLKGYVFELNANNKTGPLPDDAVTVITSVTINGVSEPNYVVVVRDPIPNPSCSCANCAGAPATHQFCTADGVMNQQVLIYTGAAPTGTSENANFCITYTVYDCQTTGNCGAGSSPDPQPLCSGTVSTPPAVDSPGGGSCDIENVFPLPGSPV
jgi:hypothetical protein